MLGEGCRGEAKILSCHVLLRTAVEERSLAAAKTEAMYRQVPADACLGRRGACIAMTYQASRRYKLLATNGG